MNIRPTSKLVAAAAAGTLLLGSAAAVAATTASPASHHATIEVWVSPPKGNSPVQKILLTGGIGDYGKATSTTKSGTPNPNGAYVHIVLQHGTFRVNAVAFNQKANSTKPTFNKSTCTFWATLTGPVTLYDGTGAYAGIGGKIHISTSFAALLPRHHSGPHKGQCNVSNSATPVNAFNAAITGGGTISLGS
jgi:hypothetical protein